MPLNGNKPQHLVWIQGHLNYPHKDFCLIWPFPTSPGSYPSFIKNGKKHYVHRFMCQATHGAPPTPDSQAAHSCHRGRDRCVNPHHLSWKTQSENLKETGSRRTIKLFPSQVDEIRSLRGIEPAHITALRFGVVPCTVKDIQAGRTWGANSRRKAMFLESDIHRIRAMKGIKTGNELAAEYGVNRNIIYKIQMRETWKHVPEANLT